MRTNIPITAIHRRNGYLSPAAKALLALLTEQAVEAEASVRQISGHRRALVAPRHRGFVGVRGPEQQRFGERLAGELHGDRKAAVAEAGADADRRESR